MSLLQEFVELCTTNLQELRLKVRRMVRPAHQTGPCVMPQSVPNFQIPKSRVPVMETSDKLLCVEGELLAHSYLPFNVHRIKNTTVPSDQGDSQHSIVKQNQHLACYQSNAQTRSDSASPSVSPTEEEKDDAEDDANFDPDHWEFLGANDRIHSMPKVQDIPSPPIGKLDSPRGSFFRKKACVGDTCAPEAVGRFIQMADCDEDNLPTQDCSQRSPRCYRRRSSIQVPYELVALRDSPGFARSSSSSLSKRIIDSGFGSWDRLNYRRPVMGELKFEIMYLLEEDRFMVTLIKGEGIGGTSQVDRDSNVFVKLCLMPGKVQTQFSEELKHTKEPHFFKEFFFKIGLTDVREMSLRMKIYNNIPKRPKQLLGEINLTLGKYNLLDSNRLWRNLEPHAKEKEDLGHLHVSLQISSALHHLKVTLGRATGLSRRFSSGLPNPFVCVEVSQESNHVIEMHTAKTTNTCFPAFKEALIFKLECVDVESLKRTRVLISVLHRDVLRSDPVIGQVRLGYDCTEHSEASHWQEVLLSPERDIGHWHYLI